MTVFLSLSLYLLRKSVANVRLMTAFFAKSLRDLFSYALS